MLSAALLAAGGIFSVPGRDFPAHRWHRQSSISLYRRNFVCSWRGAIMLSILLYTQAAEILLSGIADTVEELEEQETGGSL